MHNIKPKIGNIEIIIILNKLYPILSDVIGSNKLNNCILIIAKIKRVIIFKIFNKKITSHIYMK